MATKLGSRYCAIPLQSIRLRSDGQIVPARRPPNPWPQYSALAGALLMYWF